MAAIFTRQRIVDPQGGGTDTTIGAAITAAVAGGAAAGGGNYWQVLVAPGIYNENVTVPGGVSLNGTGALSIITGTVDVYPGTEVSGFFFDKRTSTSPYVLGLRYTGSSENFYIHNCIFYNWYDGNQTTATIECSGATSAICRIFASYIYGANRTTTDPSPNAKAVCVRLASDFASDVEIFGSHLKTSTGSNGRAESVCVLVDQAGGGGVAFGYAHIAGTDWAAGYAGLSPTPPAILIDNANTTHPGATLDMACWNPAGTMPIIRSDYTGTPTSLNVGPLAHSQLLNRGVIHESLERRWNPDDFNNGTDYTYSTVFVSDDPPPGADDMPPDTVWLKRLL